MGRHPKHTRCGYPVASTRRCSVMVPLANVLQFPRGGTLPSYCRSHQKVSLSANTVAVPTRRTNRTILCKSFIPADLEDRTQIVLRSLMSRPVRYSDRPGYIYALELADPSHPALIRIKVGRSNNVQLRLSQHRRRCPTFNPKLLGCLPYDSPTLCARPVRFCDRLERLVHVELADLSAKSHPAGRNAPRMRCTDCRSRHSEIFTFTRLQGKARGKEWHLIVRPVVQRWARFIEQLV
ncbi:hypothetical protein LXA43DRAFT_902650 [Ganoderma leucocontextum]|nr:hypothetical protein LXA43DRAFT_902650 [Ganoderma leucocontextum]